MNFRFRLWKDTSAQDLVQYALAAGFVAALAGATVPSVTGGFTHVAQRVSTLLVAATQTGVTEKAAESIPAVTPADSGVKRRAGEVKSGRGGEYTVWWNQFSHSVTVDYAGTQYVGEADNPDESIKIAQAWLADK